MARCCLLLLRKPALDFVKLELNIYLDNRLITWHPIQSIIAGIPNSFLLLDKHAVLQFRKLFTAHLYASFGNSITIPYISDCLFVLGFTTWEWILLLSYIQMFTSFQGSFQSISPLEARISLLVSGA